MEKTTIKDGVQEICLDSWRDFFDVTTEVFAKAPEYIFRGQTNYDWLLKSSLDRHRSRYPNRANLKGSIPRQYNSSPLIEQDHLKAFKRALRGRRGVNPPPLSDDDEYWALGQHYGLATPLLDWTRSPFVALFFAFEAERCFVAADEWSEPEFRGVYALSTETIQEVNYKEKPTAVRILSPESDGNHRLIGQAALFVRMPQDSDLDTHVTSHFSGRRHEATLIKIRIPNEERQKCLIALNKMNINYMTLYSDIQGAARHVNSLWQPGHEDSIAFV